MTQTKQKNNVNSKGKSKKHISRKDITSNRTQKKVSNFVNNPMDFILLISVLLLLALGIIMVLSASSPSALSRTGSSYTYLIKQAQFAVVGIIAMVIISKIDYRFYKRFGKLTYIVSIGLLILVLLVGYTINNAKRWINIGITGFQPSELVKILLIISYAAYLSEDREKVKGFFGGFVKGMIGVGVLVVLLLLEPHMSASVLLIMICSIMMIVAGGKIKHFILTGLTVGIPAIAGMIIVAPYRLKRVTTFINPWLDPKGDGWQVIQSLYAIGSGGLFGVGLGRSKQKYLYISEPHNDFIFAVLAEELGFVGMAVVIILFGILVWRGIVISMKAPDMFGSLLAIGITSLIGVQALINIAVVTSSMPVTGMPLPFFSYGGTSLMILLASVGILLNISRSGSKI